MSTSKSRITFHLDPLVKADFELFVAQRKADLIRANKDNPNDIDEKVTIGNTIEEAMVLLMETEKKKKGRAKK